MKKFLMVSLMVGLLFGLVACGSAEEGSSEAEPKEFDGTVNATLSAATSGGFMYSVGASIGNIINKQDGSNLDVLEGGGIANLMGVDNKQFEYGLVFSQDIEDALKGENNFDKELKDFRVLAALYGGYLQVAVRSESDIYSIEDLKGKSLSPGVKGYSAEALAQVVLDEYGVTYDDLEDVQFTSTADASSLMQDRHIDAISAMFPIPFSAYQELDTTMGIRILPIDSERIDNLREINPGYKEMVIPGGTYSGNEEDITVPGSITLIITHKDTPDEEAYHMVESILDNKDELRNLSVVFEDFDVNYAYDNIVGPIHPGALKYFQNQGVAEEE
ncbi:TAXI family TRAP transporter solute-binding subunit [Oceanobacillus salinisoli]|uniref:TAXI family TRAP transporter solute-binding subunit n=1 Tax=Oceanobacillus salinisoli TaxID=2678611 RepID=UPI0012E1DD01|nr:TAXI family TRAP transporter solute-binding subunit [Oceanobacillus salinisoli]